MTPATDALLVSPGRSSRASVTASGVEQHTRDQSASDRPALHSWSHEHPGTGAESLGMRGQQGSNALRDVGSGHAPGLGEQQSFSPGPRQSCFPDAAGMRRFRVPAIADRSGSVAAGALMVDDNAVLAILIVLAD